MLMNISKDQIKNMIIYDTYTEKIIVDYSYLI